MTIVIDTYKISKQEVDQFMEAYQDDKEKVGNAAIDYIEQERTRLYCIPCNWEAYFNADGTITVKRYRNKVVKNA